MSIPMLFGPYGWSPDIPDNVKEYGVNALWFHGFNEEAFDRCSRLELAACVEFKTFRASFEEHPELIPTGPDGRRIRYGRLVQGICMSQRDYLQHIEEALIEGVRRYRPRGIWLDYLTYAGWFETSEPDLQESCFCGECIRDFCEASGIDAGTPDEILQRYEKEWHEHKCRKIAFYAGRYAEIIRTAIPDCVVGAYMCPWTPQEFGGALTGIFAQDYELLAPSIDVFTPLIYCNKSGRNPHWGKEWLESSGEFISGRKAQLILDALDFPDSLHQTADSKVPSYGIQLYGGARIFHDSHSAMRFKQAVERITESIDEIPIDVNQAVSE
ncbi:hypothetical protein [Paenibacillus thermotolerans]|uniref:hypothetical protein n=1 Tax=Paenibacillus thermotolerans TaxID=3027807 RepID=UPI002368CBC0|nr:MULTISPECIES: hypothetical protein [unclassified Paenibacillus]